MPKTISKLNTYKDPDYSEETSLGNQATKSDFDSSELTDDFFKSSSEVNRAFVEVPDHKKLFGKKISPKNFDVKAKKRNIKFTKFDKPIKVMETPGKLLKKLRSTKTDPIFQSNDEFRNIKFK